MIRCLISSKIAFYLVNKSASCIRCFAQTYVMHAITHDWIVVQSKDRYRYRNRELYKTVKNRLPSGDPWRMRQQLTRDQKHESNFKRFLAESKEIAITNIDFCLPRTQKSTLGGAKVEIFSIKFLIGMYL